MCLMNTIVTMTLDDLKKTPLTEEEKQTIRKAKSIPTDDCPKQSKEELAKFRPWYEVHQKSETSIKIDADVLEWFKAQGKGYKTKINAVLRSYAFG